MIKINLLPQKRAKKRDAATEGATHPLLLGVSAVAVVGPPIFLLVDKPKRARLAELAEANQQLQNEIASKNKQLVGYAELKKAADEADERYKSIQRLLSAKVVPAHVLHELGEVLTANKYPTMTEDMAQRTGHGTATAPKKR